MIDKKAFIITPITNSSNVLAIGYDDNSHTGYIQFKNGGEYIIEELPLFVFNEWEAAQSKGSYFATHIKKQYNVVKMGVEAEAA